MAEPADVSFQYVKEVGDLCSSAPRVSTPFGPKGYRPYSSWVYYSVVGVIYRLQNVNNRLNSGLIRYIRRSNVSSQRLNLIVRTKIKG